MTPHANLANKMTSCRPAVYRSKTEMVNLLTNKSVTPYTVTAYTVMPQTVTIQSVMHGERINKTGNAASKEDFERSINPQSDKVVPSSVNSCQNYQLKPKCTAANMPLNRSVEVSPKHFSYSNPKSTSATPSTKANQPNKQVSTGIYSFTGNRLSSETIGDNQPSVARKLFPTFLPKKHSTTIQSEHQPSVRIIPIFAAHKVTSSSSLSQRSATEKGVSLSGIGNISLQSVDKGTVSSNKGVPSFQRAKPSAPTLCVVAGKSQKKANIGKVKKRTKVAKVSGCCWLILLYFELVSPDNTYVNISGKQLGLCIFNFGMQLKTVLLYIK